ncbi:MAG: cupredoxin domain-containing protein [Acidimicrobiales bacterium]
MIRRRYLAVFVLLGALLPATPGAAHAIGLPGPRGPVRAAGALPDPLPSQANHGCQPDPTDPSPQILHCRYGPLTVGPGSNLILFGPTTVESPRADGYVTKFTPDLVYADTGQVPPIHIVHLHHSVWLNPSDGNYTPFMATGEEKTVSTIPAGYGYRVHPTDEWVLNYMLHNLTPSTYEVFITYDLDWVPLATATAQGIQEVHPVWLDTVAEKDFSRSIYPIYLPDRGAGFKTSFTVKRDEELVWTAGHVHPGGLRDELRLESCSGSAQPGSPLLFSSTAVPNTGPGRDPSRNLGSWDFRMTTAPPDWRVYLKQGDQVSVTAYYDASHPWYEAMGIMLGWAHWVDPGGPTDGTPYCQVPKAGTSGAVTGVLPATPVYGGDPCASCPDPANQPTAPPSSVPVTNVAIANFAFLPGGGTGPAPVAPDSTVTFTNLDAGASIFHTATICDSPCNLDYGQSYPLSSWAGVTTGSDTSQLDSGELGFGPPFATAATERDSWSFKVPKGTPPGSTYTFFCRIHPFMRASLKVV